MGAAPSEPSAREPLTLPPSQATPLAQRLSARIDAEGPITFAAFMASALYEPELGYYSSGRPTIGREGDYLTSPEVHPLWGYAVAAQIAEVWDRLQQPAPFRVCEVGPGNGALVESLLTWIASRRPGLWQALQVDLVERSEAQRARQHQRLAAWRQPGTAGDRLTWSDSIATDQPIDGVLIANELLDAQPVHRLCWSDDTWHELYVEQSDEGRFRNCPKPVSDPALLEPLSSIEPSEGQTVEVCLELGTLVAQMAQSLRSGLLLLFDYGYPRAQLYAPWRRAGTLMTFSRHTPGDDPYVRIGQQDITCHIDIDSVRQAARAAGLRSCAARSQAEFLTAMGAGVSAGIAAGGRGADLEEYLAQRRASEALSDPGGLGRIQVMAFARGLNGALRGLGLLEPSDDGARPQQHGSPDRREAAP